MSYNFTVSYQLQHICIQWVSMLLPFTVLQLNEGIFSIAAFFVTWNSQKPLLYLSLEISAELLPTGSLEQTPPLHSSERNSHLHAANCK